MTDPTPDRCCDPDLLRRDVSDTGLELAVAGFTALWHGDRRLPAQLLPHRAAAERVASDLARHGRAELDERGRLVGIHGLTLRTTRHRFTAAGRTHHTWCAFDSIGIPAALHLDAVAHTDCPTCSGPLEVRIHQGQPAQIDRALTLEHDSAPISDGAAAIVLAPGELRTLGGVVFLWMGVDLGPFELAELARRTRYRRVANAARSSSEKSCGSSQAAKWPPLSTSLK